MTGQDISEEFIMNMDMYATSNNRTLEGFLDDCGPWIPSPSDAPEDLFALIDGLEFQRDDPPALNEDVVSAMENAPSPDNASESPLLLLENYGDMLPFPNLNDLNQSVILWDATTDLPPNESYLFDDSSDSTIPESLTFWTDEDNNGSPTDFGPEFAHEVEISSEPASVNLLVDSNQPPVSVELQRGVVKSSSVPRHRRVTARTKIVPKLKQDKKSVLKIHGNATNPSSAKSAQLIRPPLEPSNAKPETISCKECGTYFASTLTLKRHEQKVHHTKSKPLKKIEGATAAEERDARKLTHIPRVVLERISIPKPKPKGTRKPTSLHACNVCHQTFPCRVTLRHHQLDVHKMRIPKTKHKANRGHRDPQQCYLCQRVYSCKQSLKLHQVVVHKLKLENYKRIIALRAKKQQCSICGQKSTNIYHLRRHQRIMHQIEFTRTPKTVQDSSNNASLSSQVPEAGRKLKQKTFGNDKSIIDFNPMVVLQSIEIEMIQAPSKDSKTFNVENSRSAACGAKLFRRSDENPKPSRRCDICNETIEGNMILHKMDAHGLKLRNGRHKIARQSMQCALCHKTMRKQYINDHMNTVHRGSDKSPKRRITKNKRFAMVSDALSESTVKGSCPRNNDVVEPEPELASNLTENMNTDGSKTMSTNTHNPDFNDIQLQWMRAKIDNAARNAEIYSHILRKRCVVTLVDLRNSVLRVIPNERKKKVVQLDAEMTEFPVTIQDTSSASEDELNLSVASCVNSILDQFEINTRESKSEIVADLDATVLLQPISHLDCADRITEIQFVDEHGPGMCHNNSGDLTGSELGVLLHTGEGLIGGEHQGDNNPKEDIQEAPETILENVSEIETCDSSQSVQRSALSEEPDLTTCNYESQVECNNTIEQKCSYECVAKIDDPDMNYDDTDKHLGDEDAMEAIKVTLDEILKSVANKAETGDIYSEETEDVECPILKGSTVCSNGSQFQQDIADVPECSYETVIRIDDADMDYDYLDAITDHADELGLETLIRESDDEEMPVLKKQTSVDFVDALEILPDGKPSRPGGCKVLLEDVGTREVKCVICEEIVPLKYLERHKNSDHILECHICLKPCHLTEVRHHGATHVGRLQCELDGCNFTARVKYQLWEHMNTHLGLKPLFCDICGKPFAVSSDLRVHYERKHTNIRKRSNANFVSKPL